MNIYCFQRVHLTVSSKHLINTFTLHVLVLLSQESREVENSQSCNFGQVLATASYWFLKNHWLSFFQAFKLGFHHLPYSCPICCQIWSILVLEYYPPNPAFSHHSNAVKTQAQLSVTQAFPASFHPHPEAACQYKDGICIRQNVLFEFQFSTYFVM